MSRKRGGQPGNTNALKHGFYSKQFKQAEITDLNNVRIDELESEINILRVWMRRTLELAEQCDLNDAISILYALSTAANKVAMLARTQQLLQGNQDDRIDVLNFLCTDVL